MLQMRAVSRITLSPIVETLPCVGGVSITLLEPPHFDANFSLIGTFDLLSLPFVHEGFHFAVKVRYTQSCAQKEPDLKTGATAWVLHQARLAATIGAPIS